MKTFQDTLNSARKRCNGKIILDDAFNKGFSEIYPFTTENISGYINKFNLLDRKLLTVGSSGDQVLNAIYGDCRDITVLDINPYAKFYYYLKAASIIELSKEEFFEFLRYRQYFRTSQDNVRVFDKKYYERLKITLRLLDRESFLFWDELFNTFPGNQIRNNLFSMDEYSTDIIEKSNLYLYSQSYEEIKNKLKKVNPSFISGDILKTRLPESYDVIWLSNIGKYLSRRLLKKMVDRMDHSLNAKGELLISYLYQTVATTEYEKGCYPIYDFKKTLKILKKYYPEFISFPGIEGMKLNDESVKDSVLVYKKR